MNFQYIIKDGIEKGIITEEEIDGYINLSIEKKTVEKKASSVLEVQKKQKSPKCQLFELGLLCFLNLNNIFQQKRLPFRLCF